MVEAKHDDTVVGELVLVMWRDAAFNLDREPGVLPLETVGWLVRTDEDAVCLAGEREEGGGGLARSFTSVPRECITQILRLCILD